MKRAVKGALIAAMMLAVPGCASTMTVSSYTDPSMTPGVYRTFGWGPADALPTGDPRLDHDSFFTDQMQGAVEKQLAARGIALASASPDLLVHYHATVTRRIDVNLIDRTYGFCVEGACPATAQYEAGTLVVDVLDARTNRLLWRAWAQRSIEDALTDPDRMTTLITEAIARMMRRFPPAL